MRVNKCKCGDLLSRGVVGRNNGMTRVVKFLDFWEEVESWNSWIRDMEEGDVLDGKIVERARGAWL